VATRRNASLKPQLNQIRAWVQEGATDIWIAHKLGSTPASIARFRRQHAITKDGEAPLEAIDAEIAEERAAAAAEALAAPAPVVEADDVIESGDDGAARKRRGRRGGRGRTGAAAEPIELEAVFDHGDDGYGLWLDGAIRDAAIYRKHWAGHAAITVRVSADEIVIRRVP
jgi:hypothetical protein